MGLVLAAGAAMLRYRIGTPQTYGRRQQLRYKAQSK
jgi:hypothetical protein